VPLKSRPPQPGEPADPDAVLPSTMPQRTTVKVQVLRYDLRSCDYDSMSLSASTHECAHERECVPVFTISWQMRYCFLRPGWRISCTQNRIKISAIVPDHL